MAEDTGSLVNVPNPGIFGISRLSVMLLKKELKVVESSLSLFIILSFSSRRILSLLTSLFLLKRALTAFQYPFTELSMLTKKDFLVFLFKFTTKFLYVLYLAIPHFICFIFKFRANHNSFPKIFGHMRFIVPSQKFCFCRCMFI